MRAVCHKPRKTVAAWELPAPAAISSQDTEKSSMTHSQNEDVPQRNEQPLVAHAFFPQYAFP